MAATNINFRSALNGFNRTDVVQFLQAQTTEHERELRAAQAENARLQEELAAVRSEVENARAEAEHATAEMEAARTALEQALLQSGETSLPQAPTALNAPMAPAALSGTPSDFNELELAAYRRAEMTERIARERAASAAERLRSVFAQADAKLLLAGQDFSTLLDAFRHNFDQLQQSIAAAQSVMDESADSLKAAEALCAES